MSTEKYKQVLQEAYKNIKYGFIVKVLVVLLAEADSEGRVNIRQKDLGDRIGMYRPEVVEAIKVLTAKGFIEKRRIGRENVYIIR